MKIKALLLAVCLATPLMVKAEGYDSYGYSKPSSGYKYDWKTGNSYNWNTNSTGETRVQGINTKTGSMWNTTIENDGDMKGFDSKGNYWNYNSKSDSYYNYGTGEQRIGDYYYYKGSRR